MRQQPRTQHTHRGFTVLQLRLFVLHRHHNTRWKVGDAHGGVSRVHGLTAGTGGTVDVNLQVVLANLNLFGLIHLRENQHTRRGGVNTSLRFGCRNALHTVHTALIFQVRPHTFGGLIRGAFNRNLRILIAAHIGAGGGNNLGFPAFVLGVPHVHAQQVARKQRRLVAARASFYLKNHVTAIIRVTRDEQAAQFLPRRFKFSL